MLHIIKSTAQQIAEYILLTGLIVTGGIFAIDQWRRAPFLPLAGAFLGPVGGMAGAAMFGETGAIVGTFIGCFVGPGAAVMLTDRTVVRRLVEHLLDRIAPDNKGGDE